MLLWVYLLHAFFVSQTPAASTTPLPLFSEAVRMYDTHNVDIRIWGNAVWYVLHTASLYAPEPLTESFEHYRQLLLSLRNLLPCEKCRNHLTQNVNYIDFDRCGRTNLDLFKCSWKLHNIVNQATNKPLMDLQTALKMYTN